MAWPNSQARYVALTIPAAQFTGPISDFPVLITAASLTDGGDLDAEILDADTSGSTECQSDGGDIRFAMNADGTTQLDYQIVKFSKNSTPANAEIEIWVKLDLAENSGSGTTFYMAWDTAGTTSDGSDAASTFSVYDNVYHLQEDASGGAGSIIDAAGSDDGTPLSGVSDADAPWGNTGGAVSFDGSDDQINIGDIFEVASGTELSISAWINKHAVGSGAFFLSKADGSNYDFGCYINGSDNVQFFWGSNQTDASSLGITDSTWHRVAITVNSSGDLVYYVNGSSDATGTGAVTFADKNAGLIIGARGPAISDSFNWHGQIDEVRVALDVLDADWQEAEFNNQSAPGTFITEGTPTDVGGAPSISVPVLYMHRMQPHLVR